MAQFVQQTTAISSPSTGATAGTALNPNTARVYFQIQNIGSNPIYLLLGTGSATAGNCHEILHAGSAPLDGNGGIFRSGTVCFTGAVQVGGTAPTYTAFEIAP